MGHGLLHRAHTTPIEPNAVVEADHPHKQKFGVEGQHILSYSSENPCEDDTILSSVSRPFQPDEGSVSDRLDRVLTRISVRLIRLFFLDLRPLRPFGLWPCDTFTTEIEFNLMF